MIDVYWLPAMLSCSSSGVDAVGGGFGGVRASPPGIKAYAADAVGLPAEP